MTAARRALALTLAIAASAGCERANAPASVTTQPAAPARAPEPSRGTAEAPQATAAEMPRVAAGEYALGPPESLRRERLSAFAIDRLEVTLGGYAQCVDAGACSAPAADTPACNWASRAERAAHPANCVTWGQADAYCAWAGKRLPSESEWEAAARGEDARPYPWGEAAPAAQLCWNGPGADDPQRTGTCPAGAFPAGASPSGALDMAGNVWEWTSSPEPLPEGGSARVYRGGGYEHDPLGPPAVHSWERAWMTEDYAASDLGFRCARSDAPR